MTSREKASVVRGGPRMASLISNSKVAPDESTSEGDEPTEPITNCEESTSDCEELTSDCEEPTDNDDDEEPWQAYLPFIAKEMVEPIFCCFLKRAASILSAVDFPEDSKRSAKLISASVGLLKLYEYTDEESIKCSFLRLVAQQKAFVDFVIQMACQIIAFQESLNIQPWLESLARFLKLVCLAVELCDDMHIQLGHLELLAKSFHSFDQDVIESVSKINARKQIICPTLRILFKCVIESKDMKLESYHLQSLKLLVHASDAEIRLLTKSFLTALSSKFTSCKEVESSCYALKEDEVLLLMDVLNTKPWPVKVSLYMLYYLTKLAENGSRLIQSEILSSLTALSDKPSDEEQKLLAVILQQLMQFQSEGNTICTIAEADFMLETSDKMDLISDNSPQELLPPSEAALEFTDLLLNFLIKTLLPYEGIPLEEGLQLPESTWYTIGECLLLIFKILAESDDSVKEEIVACAATHPGCCKSMQLAYIIALNNKKEGVPKSIISSTMDAIMVIIFTFSDDSRLAQEIARSGFVQFFTAYLTTGLHFATIFPFLRTRLVCTLFTFFNLSLNPANYPAFFFAETTKELLPFVNLESFDLASNAKFILSSLHMSLSRDELFDSKLTDEDLKYCIDSLTSAVSAPDFKADGFSVNEFLHILTNVTHPRYLMASSVMYSSSFDREFIKAGEDLLKNYIIKLTNYGILSLLDCVMNKKKFRSTACKLLWNLLHHESIKEKISFDCSGICDTLKVMATSEVLDDKILSDCCLWMLKKADIEDLNTKLMYAQVCYKFKCYAEVYSVCSDVIENITGSDESSMQILSSAKLLKGKAIFYGYQRKMVHYMQNKSKMAKPEERKLLNECFKSILETVNVLGKALDEAYLDEEGSKLLDWAMMDCIRETNWLNRCNRCFLCRRSGPLQRSHIFPKFQLKQSDDADGDEKGYMFGRNIHQMKSAGECWMWLCCRRCELIMSQNAEDPFSKKFPSSGTMEYTSWLFNYCNTILFRTFSVVKFPLFLNDDEVYEVFLSCRKHLLSLPVKMKNSRDAIHAEMEKFQHQLLSKIATKDIEPYIFTIPDNVYFEREDGVYEKGLLNVSTLSFMSLRRLADGCKDMANQPHFFVSYVKGLIIMLRFTPSAQCVVPENCRVSKQKGTYTIPDNSEAIKLIPKGLWELHQSSALEYFQSTTDALRQLTPRAAEKMGQAGAFSDLSDILEQLIIEPIDGDDAEVPTIPGSTDSSDYDIVTVPLSVPSGENKPQLSMLPPDFKIVKSFSSIQLPKGHKVVLHGVENSSDLTIFLAAGDSGSFSLDHPYMIYLFDNVNNAHTHADGVFIEEVDNEISLTNFLLEHSVYAQMRPRLKEIQERAKICLVSLLRKNKFTSLNMFINYLKCHWFIGDMPSVPSLGLKCSPEGCWYCKYLCYCCMKPAVWMKVANAPDDSAYRFCSEQCYTNVCTDPSVIAKTLVVANRRDEYFNGSCKSSSVLDIVNVYRKEGSSHNIIELLNICLGDGSDNLPHGPYVLWQARQIDSQDYNSLVITEACIPTRELWPTPDANAASGISLELQDQLHFSEVLKNAARELGYTDFSTFFCKFFV